MKLKVPITNRGYVKVLEEIGNILEQMKNMADAEIEEIFKHYAEVVAVSDEAAAVLTLAEILKGKEGHPSAKEGHSGEEGGNES